MALLHWQKNTMGRFPKTTKVEYAGEWYAQNPFSGFLPVTEPSFQAIIVPNLSSFDYLQHFYTPIKRDWKEKYSGNTNFTVGIFPDLVSRIH